MTRTLLHIDAAACAHHDGDSEQACRRAIAALTALPDGYRIGLVHQRTQDLYEAIPARHHHEPAVRELRDVLAVWIPGFSRLPVQLCPRPPWAAAAAGRARPGSIARPSTRRRR
ncbi:hypothetical protein [Streptomyces hirsutus]|uniref:hypothetical protein n=1 Tax=Streptomyces hirsutus TaxID=35620 RepID=UPI00331E323F